MKIQFVLVILLWCTELYCYQTRPHEDHSHQYALKEQFYWGIPDFKFPNVSAKTGALSTESYIPENNAFWGIGVWRDKIFVSVFRYKKGVASSFNYFLRNSTIKSPILMPYPSFDANYINEDPLHRTVILPSNSSIICAGYFRIDKCDRLWVIDAGIVELFGQIRVVALPAIVIFDLRTNTLLRRYVIPAEFVNSNIIFDNLDIDFNGSGCDDAYAYVVDMFRSIVVYSLKKNRSWRLVHNLFGSDPSAGIFLFEGVNVQWNFGAMGITVGGRRYDGSRRVYVNPFASTKSYYISNKILQNEKYIAKNDYYYDVRLLGDRGKNGQIFTWIYDNKTDVLFDTQFNRHRIGCWNTAKPYNKSSFGVVYKSDQSFSADDINIDSNRNIWLLDSKLPRFLFGSWIGNTKNIQIFKAKVDDVISGTVCRRKLPK